MERLAYFIKTAEGVSTTTFHNTDFLKRLKGCKNNSESNWKKLLQSTCSEKGSRPCKKQLKHRSGASKDKRPVIISI